MDILPVECRYEIYRRLSSRDLLNLHRSGVCGGDLEKYMLCELEYGSLCRVELVYVYEKANSVRLREYLLREYVDWHSLFRYSKLSESFLLEYEEKLDMCDASHRGSTCWKCISWNQDLSVEYIRAKLSRLNVSVLMLRGLLSVDEILSEIGRVKREGMLMGLFDCARLDERVLRVLVSSVRGCSRREREMWKSISRNQVLSSEFIDEYGSKLNWSLLLRYQNVEERLLDKYSCKLSSQDWYRVSSSISVSERFVYKYSCKLYWGGDAIYWTGVMYKKDSSFDDGRLGREYILGVSGSQYMSEDLILLFLDKVCWREIFLYQKGVSGEFLQKYAYRLQEEERLRVDLK